jgi:hypothetical protein
LPHDVLCRLFCSPVPAYTTLGSDAEMATSPNVLTGMWSKTLRQVCARLVVFHRPPDAEATKMVDGSSGSASMSWTRPPVTAGPMDLGAKARS